MIELLDFLTLHAGGFNAPALTMSYTWSQLAKSFERRAGLTPAFAPVRELGLPDLPVYGRKPPESSSRENYEAENCCTLAAIFQSSSGHLRDS